jgi:hypothetical protein
MIEYIGDSQVQPARPTLQLGRSTCSEALSELNGRDPQSYGGVEVSMLMNDLDIELAQALLKFCAAVPSSVASLSVTHSDLGSGTDCEQRMFDLTAERKVRESEKAWAEKLKRDSSKEKDFAAAAAKRRQGQEGTDSAVQRITEIDDELAHLEKEKLQTSWYALFSEIQAANFNSIHELDLSNCGLHVTGLGFLTQLMLDLENRAEGAKISWLVLDGNGLGDQGMGILASFLRLSKSLEGLQLRNVGITEVGVSELVAGLVSNKNIRLLDVRSNGLCNLETAQAAISGVQRFNGAVQILLT